MIWVSSPGPCGYLCSTFSLMSGVRLLPTVIADGCVLQLASHQPALGHLLWPIPLGVLPVCHERCGCCAWPRGLTLHASAGASFARWLADG